MKTTNLIINHYKTSYLVNSELPCTMAWIMTKLTLQHNTVDTTRKAFIGLPPIFCAFPFPVGIMCLKSKRSNIVSFPGKIYEV